MNLLRVLHVLGQLLDGVERFLSDTVTLKSQVTSDCETDHQVLDQVPRHCYLRPTIFELTNFEIKQAFSFVIRVCDMCFALVNLHTRPCVVMRVESSVKHTVTPSHYNSLGGGDFEIQY